MVERDVEGDAFHQDRPVSEFDRVGAEFVAGDRQVMLEVDIGGGHRPQSGGHDLGRRSRASPTIRRYRDRDAVRLEADHLRI